MHQGIDQELLKHSLGDLRQTRRVHSSPRLHLVQVAHDKGQRTLKELRQRAGKIFGVKVVGGVDFVTGVADRLDHELRYNPLRLLGKQQHPGQIQPALIGRQIHVLKQPGQFLGGIGVLLFVNIAQKITETQLVQLINACLGG